MKKIFALALAIVMMMAIALPAFATNIESDDTSKATGATADHIYGSLTESAADSNDVDDEVIIKYGVYQEYVITIPADVNFGYLSEETNRYETTRTVSASDVVINGKEYLVVKVTSANAWQMVDQDKKSVNVYYDATLDNPLTEAADEIKFDHESDGLQTILVVDHAAGNEGWQAKAGGNVDITFTTAGTAQEGTYKDTLTFAVEIVETDPVTRTPVAG